MEIKNLSYHQTIELEKNLKTRDRADKIYKDFVTNVTFPMERYQGKGKFLVKGEELTCSWFQLFYNDSVDYWMYIYTHRGETAKVGVIPQDIYNAIKRGEIRILQEMHI